jgi:LPPG:FO 2-phospho-L-lactate transferase
MKVVALAGGIGAGKFLRGLSRVVAGDDLSVIVNVADDITVHGLRVCPDPDSVTYWLGGVFDRKRGWGRAGETFRATTELEAFGADGAWFGLGDLDLATHLYRSKLLADGVALSDIMGRIARRFGVAAHLLPATEDMVQTRIMCTEADTGRALDLHFQEYWVQRGGADAVTSVRYEGVDDARPAPGVLEALTTAAVVVLCPSNPVVSIGPILAVPGVREAVAARRDSVVGISGIVGGAPVSGMADRLMPAVGIEVSAAGVAAHYRDIASGWLMDGADRHLVPRVEDLGLRTATTDTIMNDDERAEAVARSALDLVR